MILSARAAGAMAAARLMGTNAPQVPYPAEPRQAPPPSPYHQQQHQLAVPSPRHRPAPASPYPPELPAPQQPQQGPYDVHVSSQVRRLRCTACMTPAARLGGSIDVFLSLRDRSWVPKLRS